MQQATQQPTNAGADADALEFARRVVPLFEAALGADLIGVYLLGSLAHGGFSRRYSDIDVAAVTAADVPAPALDRVRREALALSAEWAPKLSVFWADRQFAQGRFPPLDRVDYLDHAVPLLERERVQPPRPTLDEIRCYLAGTPLADWTARARRFADASSLAPNDRKAYLRTLLYPARFCFSFITGRMGSNDEAVSFLAGDAPAALDIEVITCALQCRQAEADPDALFPARATLPAQVDACVALAAGLA